MKNHSLVLNNPVLIPPFEQVQINTSTLLSISDHYIRKGANDKRVIGPLFGRIEEEIVVVNGAYGIQHVDKDSEVLLDLDATPNLLGLHREVYPDDVVVGWYSTASFALDYLVHEYFLKEGEGDAVYLVYDHSGIGEQTMEISCYYSHFMELNGNNLQMAFRPLSYKVTDNTQEMVALDVITKQATKKKVEIQNPQTTNDIITGSIELLDQIENYIMDVLSGKVKPTYQVGVSIDETLGLLPTSPEEFADIFQKEVNDIKVLKYLSDLSKQYLFKQEKLN
eukprot:TRINITY_DN9680_c0_g1_i1.p1 TRINITY_DN9680_c0_g1~~TRINITY_DN9680_c0_g1_i1.p1  ORF type:complete len:280 (-),score=76.70 TRINITY_DN9680_c0_g1_i1:34-873(-)